MSYKNNNWVTFLRKYAPSPENEAMYDENIQWIAKDLNVRSLQFDTPRKKQLIQNFRSDDPVSVILTGTAGDGKTHLCREVWNAISPDPDGWDQNRKIHKTILPCNRTLTIIKDLSEVIVNERTFLEAFARTLLDSSSNDVYLIAANDGQLLSALTTLGKDYGAEDVASKIETMLIEGLERDDRLSLRLYNLSRTDVQPLFKNILDELVNHEGWDGCKGCIGIKEDPAVRCPIWHNLEIMKKSELFQQRLTDLLVLCEMNDLHMPIRQILILLTNALLGHRKADNSIMSCDSINDLKKTRQDASPYMNLFGANFIRRKRENLRVFDVLGRFGIGGETNNKVDNVLIYGRDDPDLKSYYDTLVANDIMYGAHKPFLTAVSEYLDAGKDRAAENLTTQLEGQRQRLFFTVPREEEKNFRLWELSRFRHGGEYLDSVYRLLLDGKPVPSEITYKIVRGLNRIFTGLLINEERKLYIASSTNNSQARVSRLLVDTISVAASRKGEKIVLEYDASRKRVLLCVYISQEKKPNWIILHPVRYEFLVRVSNGALPSSFSSECYEDFLAFKSQIHAAITNREDSEPHPGDGSISLTLLEVSDEGNPSEVNIEVKA